MFLPFEYFLPDHESAVITAALKGLMSASIESATAYERYAIQSKLDDRETGSKSLEKKGYTSVEASLLLSINGSIQLHLWRIASLHAPDLSETRNKKIKKISSGIQCAINNYDALDNDTKRLLDQKIAHPWQISPFGKDSADHIKKLRELNDILDLFTKQNILSAPRPSNQRYCELSIPCEGYLKRLAQSDDELLGHKYPVDLEAFAVDLENAVTHHIVKTPKKISSFSFNSKKENFGHKTGTRSIAHHHSQYCSSNF
jgi:hypothetical protein